MTTAQLKTLAKKLEKSIRAEKLQKYVLKLYITGATPRSIKAIMNIRKICEEHLKGRYELEIIDIFQQPVLAKGEQIIAAPTLVKKLPLPMRRIIGDMSNRDRVLLGLDLVRSSNQTGGGVDDLKPV